MVCVGKSRHHQQEFSDENPSFVWNRDICRMFSAVNLFAQDTGEITGTVRDNTGAVIRAPK